MKNHILCRPAQRVSRLPLFLSLILVGFTTAHAAVPPPAVSDTIPANVQPAAPAITVKKPFEIGVEGVTKYRNQVKNRCEPSLNHVGKDYFVYPGDYISVKINDTNMRTAYEKRDSIRLWINGICYPHLKPIYFDHNNSALIFNLTLDSDTADHSPWKLFYKAPNYWTFYHYVTVNLGTSKREFASKDCPQINLYTSGVLTLILGYGFFIGLIVLLLRYAKGMLRDVDQYARNGVTISYNKKVRTSAETGTINVADLPYSLSRFQFMVWLIIIFFSIVHIFVITDRLTTPTDGVLLLLGISGGTFFLGRLIDTQPQVTTDQQDPAQTVTSFIANDKTKGFWFDLLYDSKTLSLHRLQLLMFTLFLAFYFICDVLHDLSMPDFSTNMMLLMGISSGTYAGIKTIEKKAGTPTAPTTPTTPTATT